MIIALRRQVCIEHFILAFYMLSVAWFAFELVAIYTKMSFMENTDILSTIYLIVYSVLFVADLSTMIYFIKMGHNYITVLDQQYTIPKRLVHSAIFFLFFWITVTLFRYEIYDNIAKMLW